METKYNLKATVEKHKDHVPRELYDRTVELYHSEGLLGEKRVENTGRLLDGHDKSCNVYVIGEFDLHYIEPSDETMREMLEKAELTTSGFDNVGQKALELGSFIVDSLERVDPPSQVLSYSDYNSFPICPNMELSTPLGRQSLHMHTDGYGIESIIQLWRPNKERQWYDWDTFKKVLDNALLEEMDLISEKVTIPKHNVIKRLVLERKRKKLSKLSRLAAKVRRNPRCIDKVDFF